MTDQEKLDQEKDYQRRVKMAVKELHQHHSRAQDAVPQDERLKWVAQDYRLEVSDLEKAFRESDASAAEKPLPEHWREKDLYKIKRFWAPYMSKEIVLQLYNGRIAKGTLVAAEQGFIELEKATVVGPKYQALPKRVNIDRRSIQHFHEPCEVETLDEASRDSQQAFILETVHHHLKHTGMKGILGTIARLLYEDSHKQGQAQATGEDHVK